MTGYVIFEGLKHTWEGYKGLRWLRRRRSQALTRELMLFGPLGLGFKDCSGQAGRWASPAPAQGSLLLQGAGWQGNTAHGLAAAAKQHGSTQAGVGKPATRGHGLPNYTPAPCRPPAAPSRGTNITPGVRRPE